MTQSGPLYERSEAAAGAPSVGSPAPVWLQRMSLVVLVLFSLYVGVLLAVLPWSPRFWDHNAWLLAHPKLFQVLRMGWARGVLSGLGLLDIWIGVSEALHYRDYRGPSRTAGEQN